MRLSGLVDCNSFFASCEQVFAPHLVGKPVIVLSNNDGCVVARSREAKRLGIPMGAPFFEVRRLCENERVAVFSGNFHLYGDMSRRVMQCLRQWTPRMEIYSVDEAFLDLTGVPNAETPAFQRDLVNMVQKWTGIPVSLGVARTKTLAKVANHVAKKSGAGFFTIDTSAELQAILAPLPVVEIWGVGARSAKKLTQLGIRSAWDLVCVDPLWARKQFSVVLERIVRELQGEPCLEQETLPAPKQSIQISRSFADRITALSELEKPVSTFTARAMEKLRAQDGLVNAVYLSVIGRWAEPQVEDAPAAQLPPSSSEPASGWSAVPKWAHTAPPGTFYSDGVTIPLGRATDNTRDVLPMVLAALRQLYHPRVAYKKAGVTLLGLTSRGDDQQTLLFDNTPGQDAQRGQRLMEVLDQINASLGGRSVVFGSEELPSKRSWHGRSERKSPNYTTDWDDLPRAK